MFPRLDVVSWLGRGVALALALAFAVCLLLLTRGGRRELLSWVMVAVRSPGE